MSSSEWREAWAALAERATPTDACPPAERLWEAARGELGPGQVAALVDHVAQCALCAEAWEVAADLAKEAAPVQRASVMTFPSRRVWAWASLAAAAVIVIGVLVVPRGWIGRGAEGPADVYRTELPQAVRPLNPDGQVLPRQAAALRWSSAGDNATYSIEVATEDLTPIARASNLKTTEYTIPEKALSALPAGSRVVWRVHASWPDGRSIRSAAAMIVVQ
jgi:hypothetical protein